jgi:hypothetical protein
VKARIVMDHAEIEQACCAWVRAHGMTDFSDAHLHVELASEEHVGGQRTLLAKATVDINIKPSPKA